MRHARCASQYEIDPRFALEPCQEFLVALGCLRDDLLVRLALAGLEPRLRVRADEIAQLPTVALDNVPNNVANHGGRNGFGERGGEQSAKPSPMRVETVLWRRRCFGEDRRGDDPRLHDGDAHIEGADLLGEDLAKRLEGPFRRGVARHRRARQPACDRGDVDDGSLAPLAHAWDYRLDAAKTAEEIGFHHLAKVIDRRLFHRAAARDTGVVDQNVDRAVPSDHFGEGLAYRGVVVDVELCDMDRKLFFLGDFADLSAALQIAHGGHNSMARACERDSRREPDAAV